MRNPQDKRLGERELLNVTYHTYCSLKLAKLLSHSQTDVAFYSCKLTITPLPSYIQLYSPTQLCCCVGFLGFYFNFLNAHRKETDGGEN